MSQKNIYIEEIVQLIQIIQLDIAFVKKMIEIKMRIKMKSKNKKKDIIKYYKVILNMVKE